MRNKVLAIAAVASLMIPSSASAQDGCDSCIAVIGGMVLGAVWANNSHPHQPEYTPSRGQNYNPTKNVPDFNPAYPRSYYYNQDNAVPPPPLPPEIQDQYRLQYKHQPEYQVVYPQQQQQQQPQQNRRSRQPQSYQQY